MDIYLWFSFLQVSVGTLLAFTMVACSVLILRYIPPDEVPLTPSHQKLIGAFSLQHSSSSQKIDVENPKVSVGTSNGIAQPLIAKEEALADPVIVENAAEGRFTCEFVKNSPFWLWQFPWFSAI